MSLEIQQVTRYYGQQKALDNVSFSLKKGELAGFLGPNGAGKTTLMKIITGFLPPSEGEILINGIPMQIDIVELKREIVYLPENNPLYNDLYVAEYLDTAARFYRLRNIREKVREMIGLTGLEPEQHKKIGALSKGYRQRVGLAQALIHQPSVLILDEPTSGLDPNQVEEIRNLITGISEEKTVLLSSHILREIETICNRVVIINKGRVVADSDISELRDISLIQSQQVFAEFDRQVSSTAFSAIEGIHEFRQEGKGWLFTAIPGKDLRPALFRFAVDSRLTLLTLTERRQDLEDIFQQLTKG